MVELFNKFFSIEIAIGVMIALCFGFPLGVLLVSVLKGFVEQERGIVKRRQEIDQNKIDIEKRKQDLTRLQEELEIRKELITKRKQSNV